MRIDQIIYLSFIFLLGVMLGIGLSVEIINEEMSHNIIEASINSIPIKINENIYKVEKIDNYKYDEKNITIIDKRFNKS